MAWRTNLNKAQAAVEYALIIVAIVAGLIATATYLRRGIQGRVRASADSIGEQYAPGNTTGRFSITQSSNAKVTSDEVSEEDLGRDLDGDSILEEDVYGIESTVNIIYENVHREGSENIEGY